MIQVSVSCLAFFNKTTERLSCLKVGENVSIGVIIIPLQNIICRQKLSSRIIKGILKNKATICKMKGCLSNEKTNQKQKHKIRSKIKKMEWISNRTKKYFSYNPWRIVLHFTKTDHKSWCIKKEQTRRKWGLYTCNFVDTWQSLKSYRDPVRHSKENCKLETWHLTSIFGLQPRNNILR